MFKKFVVLLLMLFCSVTVIGCSSSSDPIVGPDEPIIEPQTKTTREIMEEALEEIASYKDKSLYRDAQVVTLNELINNYKEEISKCRDRERIAQLVSQFKMQADLLKTDIELTQEEVRQEEEIKKCKIYEYMNKTDHYDILFIGSSYLYYFDQYRILENILQSQGFDASCDQVVRGSATLEMFNDQNDDLYGKLQAKLESTQYEYIFIEELSTRPIKKYDLFESNVGKLVDRINTTQDHCETILYDVWARDEDCDWYASNPGYDFEKMNEELVSAYQTVASKYRLRLTYPGQSFYKVYKTQNKAVNLYYKDKTHPNINGAYLGALTTFNTLTGIDPNKVSYVPTNFSVTEPTKDTYSVTEENATILKNSVVNYYGDEKLPELKVYIWASNTGATYYTPGELEEIKLALKYAIKKDVVILWNPINKVNKQGFKDYMKTVDDADIIFAGANMDSDCEIELKTEEEYQKSLLGLNWTSDTSRYIGIAKNAKNLVTAKLFRDYLIQEKKVSEITNVLFIGNSYTYYNDMYIMFEELCKSMDINVKAYKVTLGSRKLTDYQSLDETTLNLKDKLSKIKFNYIFLQEQSSLPITNYNSFRSGVNVVSNIIQNTDLNRNAKIMLYNTWARQEGNSFYNTHYTELESNDAKLLAMTKDLVKAYENCGTNFGYDVSYCGIAMYEVHKNYPSLNMYHTDKTHPSPLASYMVALCHAAKIFKIDPREVTYIPNFSSFIEGDCTCVMPTQEEAAILRNAAYNVTFHLDTSYFN